MLYPLDDTIVAIASTPGGAARGILRLSGPRVRACVDAAFQPDARPEWSAVTRPTVVAGSLRLGRAPPLSCDVYWWPGRRSYTGQPTAEIHTLGCLPLLEAALRAFCEAGARLAEPGEFTLRAFLAGRLDLTQAEAVLGVVDARDPKQFDVALTQLAGGLAGPMHRLRERLLDLLAHLEAGFDFADEDLPFIGREDLNAQLAEAARTALRLARRMESRGQTTNLVRVVLVGWPNVGKSSLFNALAPQSGALVSRHPGTTRDYLTAELDLSGARCLLVDTAGVEPEPAGRDRSLRRAVQAASGRQRREADVELLCLDSTRPLNCWELDQLAGDAAGRLVVLTKVDLLGQTDRTESRGCDRAGARGGLSAAAHFSGGGKPLLPPTCRTDNTGVRRGRAIRTSSVTGEGLSALRERLRDVVVAVGAPRVDVVPSTAARCRESLRLAAESLKRARRLVSSGGGEELTAVEIRTALEELGKVVGAVYTEDVLDRIFSRFCIGK